jgi:hypothetical protein
MGRSSAALVAALGVALLLFAAASQPAKKLFVPAVPPRVAAGPAQRIGAASLPAAWIPRSDLTHRTAMMTLMDRESVLDRDSAEDGSLGQPGQGLGDEDQDAVAKESFEEGVKYEWEDDPYNVEQTKKHLKEEQERFDNLLRLKEKLEAELPFVFLEDLDSSHFASDVVFKEPHLPPIRTPEL